MSKRESRRLDYIPETGCINRGRLELPTGAYGITDFLSDNGLNVCSIVLPIVMGILTCYLPELPPFVPMLSVGSFLIRGDLSQR